MGLHRDLKGGHESKIPELVVYVQPCVRLRHVYASQLDAQREAEERREKLEKRIAARLETLQTARTSAECALQQAKEARGELAFAQDQWAAIEQGVDAEDVRRARLGAPAAAGGYVVHGPGPRRGVV